MRTLLCSICILFFISAKAQWPSLSPSAVICPQSAELPSSDSLSRRIGVITRLHPCLGNAIRPQDRDAYCLFPEIPDSIFEMAQLLRYNDSTYAFIIYTKNEGRSPQPVGAERVLDMYLSVEKIKPAPAVIPQQPVAKPQFIIITGQVLDIVGTIIALPIKAYLFWTQDNSYSDPYNAESRYMYKDGEYYPSH